MLDLQSFKGFTPGRWSSFAPDGDNGRFTVERLASNPFVPSRKIAIVNADKGNMEANARLIAAAPDLLALAIKQEKALRVAAGLISTMPQFADKHPQEALDWIMAESAKETSHA